MYTIKDKNGNTVCKAEDSNTAFAFYRYVANKTGYAEVWYYDELILKTK